MDGELRVVGEQKNEALSNGASGTEDSGFPCRRHYGYREDEAKKRKDVQDHARDSHRNVVTSHLDAYCRGSISDYCDRKY